MIYPSVAAIGGIIITMATTNLGARYFALFPMLAGTYGCFQISNAWMANIAARPQKKRAIALAMNNALGNTALVWTPYLYPASDGPRYMTGKLSLPSGSLVRANLYSLVRQPGPLCCYPLVFIGSLNLPEARQQEARPALRKCHKPRSRSASGESRSISAP